MCKSSAHFKVVQNIAYIIRGVTYELVVLQ